MLIKILLEWSAKDHEMLQADIAFQLQHTKFSVLRLIPRLWYSYYLKFQNLKSKLKFEIQSKLEISSQSPELKIYEHAHTNFEL